MKVAFAIWNGRIAPVFDTAGEVLILNVVGSDVTDESREMLPVNGSAQQRTDCLKSIGVELLVCGAVSRFVKAQVESQGIKVISFVSGDVRDVIKAWLDNEIERDIYAMPGCRRRRRGGWCDGQFKKNTGGGGRRGHFGPKCRGV